MAGDARQAKVIIIGAGLGGIITAINLKRKLGFTNFTIYEKASDIGGTWRDNTYPGCSCDIPVHWYSFSSEINPDWSSHYAAQPEILNYWRALALKYNLYPHIVFSTRVVCSTWDATMQTWKVEIETRSSGERIKIQETVTAELVVSAAGGFVIPAFANLEGLDAFQGQMFHSARWDYGVDLRGKRVGVIGNGCSAVQFIPKISEDPSVKVINFCRTPNWVVPKMQFQYSATIRWIFRHVPLAARTWRNLIAVISDWAFVIWRRENTKARGRAERRILTYMRKAAPEKYHEDLTPRYPLGCKRIIVDPDYYASLHRPNVELQWGGVKKIVKDGVITNDGKKHELDVIIYGTGFVIVDTDLQTIGKGGQTLMEYFDSRGGPEAYLGTTIPGFPNLFTILGPNVASGHASAIFGEEQQIGYALQLMRPVIEGKARSFEVRAEISHAFNDDLQRRLRETTWVSCQSYYRMGTEGEKPGKVIATFPGPVLRFWYLTRKVRWSDYLAVGAEKWERERRMEKLARCLSIPLLLAVACLATWKSGDLASAIANVLDRKTPLQM